MNYKYNPPLLIKKLFSSFQWESESDKILFTFDDGPVPAATDLVLKKLDENKIKAVFFCVGDNIRKYPDLAKAILEEEHIIGNHTFHHKKLTGMNREETLNELNSFNNLVMEKFNYSVKYFRPPYGRFTLSTSKILSQLKLKNVMWSLLTYDFNNNLETVKLAIDRNLQKKSIIVLHDSLKCKQIATDSIQYIIDAAQRKNLQIGKPDECLKQSF